MVPRRFSAISGRWALALLPVTIALASCSGAADPRQAPATPGQVPGSALRAANAFVTTVPITTHDMVDIGIPNLDNMSDTPLQVLSITLRRPALAVHYGHMDAFSYSRVGSGIIDQLGDLTKLCPQLYRPLAPSDLIVPARTSAPWFALICARVYMPGKYALGSFRVVYRMDQNDDVTYYQNLALSETLDVRSGPAQRLGKSECDRP